MKNKRLPDTLRQGLQEAGITEASDFSHVSHLITDHGEGCMIVSMLLFDAKPDSYYEHWYRERAEAERLDVELLGERIQVNGHSYELLGVSPLMKDYPLVLYSATAGYLHSSVELLHKLKRS